MTKEKTWNLHILLNKLVTDLLFTAVFGGWPVEPLAELADGSMGVVKWRGVGVRLPGTSV
jgi:hypothetical protein